MMLVSVSDARRVRCRSLHEVASAYRECLDPSLELE